MDLNLFFVRIRNFAELDEPGSPELANIVLPMPLAEALRHIQDAVKSMPLWSVESADLQAGTIHLVRRTKVFRFADDIKLRLEPVEGGTRLHGRSQSRLGMTDLGQNRRNLRELIARLGLR